ncbi:MAG: hypothetical protein GC149_20295 [Gammaproteobacteria bacterium]|nr:hypothetical protein [Gammaproteobacteria bacterium]
MKHAIMEPTISPRLASQILWATFVGVMLVLANINREFPGNHWYITAAFLMLRVLIGVWVFVDANEHKFSIQSRSNYGLLSIFLGEIVLPIYLVKSRGWMGAWKTVVQMLGFLVIALLSSVLIQAIILFVRKNIVV